MTFMQTLEQSHTVRQNISRTTMLSSTFTLKASPCISQKIKWIFMRPLIADSPNALDLIAELDQATEQMMSLSVEHVGTEQWQAAFVRQQSAFKRWREYLYCKADEKPPVRLLNIA